MPSSGIWSRLGYVGVNFVAVIPNTTTAAYSSDGITWTPITLPISGNWIKPITGGNVLLLIAQGSSQYLYTNDGVNWNNVSTIVLYQNLMGLTNIYFS
jgi:hypothetical protein